MARGLIHKSQPEQIYVTIIHKYIVSNGMLWLCKNGFKGYTNSFSWMFHKCMFEAYSVYIDTFHSFQGSCEHSPIYIQSKGHNVSIAVFLRNCAGKKCVAYVNPSSLSSHFQTKQFLSIITENFTMHKIWISNYFAKTKFTLRVGSCLKLLLIVAQKGTVQSSVESSFL